MRGAPGRFHSSNFLFIWRPNGLVQTRLGITVTKRVANAVGRNHIKRRLREAFRKNRSQLPPGLDVVAIARQKAQTLSGNQVLGQFLDAARAMQKWRPRP